MQEKIIDQRDDYKLILSQTGIDEYRVSYGLDVRGGLSWLEAAHQYGECLFHALRCDSKLEEQTLEIEECITSADVNDPDDVPTTDTGKCRYWGAFEDSPIPHERVWVMFNRHPLDETEVAEAVQEYFGD